MKPTKSESFQNEITGYHVNRAIYEVGEFTCITHEEFDRVNRRGVVPPTAIVISNLTGEELYKKEIQDEYDIEKIVKTLRKGVVTPRS